VDLDTFDNVFPGFERIHELTSGEMNDMGLQRKIQMEKDFDSLDALMKKFRASYKGNSAGNVIFF
jgi:hypothetical protein